MSDKLVFLTGELRDRSTPVERLGNQMTVRFWRSLGVTMVAILGAVVLAFSGTVPSLLPVLTATVLAMGGTEHPLSTPPDSHDFVTGYLEIAVENHIIPASGKTGEQDTGIPSAPYKTVAVITPEEFWPVFGSKTFGKSVAEGRSNFGKCAHADAGCEYNEPVSDPLEPDDFIGVGYSQSAVVASLVKADLIAEYRDDPMNSPIISFYLLSNPMRPNGGILMKFNKLTIPILDIPMYGATPTDTCQEDGEICYPTVDFAYQYDILGGGAPNNLFSLVALLNSLAGYLIVHGDMPDQNLNDDDVIYQGKMGDTQYYMRTTDLVPLLMPLESLGVPRELLLVVNAPMQTLIEGAYRRDIHPGEPTPQYLISISNPVGVGINFLKAIPVGIDDALEEAGHQRIFGTEPAGPYGVGGEDKELEGLPAGFIPLGKADPTPDTSEITTNNLVDVTGSDERADVEGDQQTAVVNDDVDTGTEVKKDRLAKRPLKTALKERLDKRPVKSALKDRLKDRIEKRQKAIQDRPKPMRPKSVRPGDRPLRKAIDRVREQRQNATSRGSNSSETS
ncbi:PE-PPE domain-containing protein, partial [Micromonospora sp. WMMD736]|uniref:PE-PPE domain-containing protein n=1 Tax=Micromonospora sp. WMMD736 TaxID=3404112 RepID=UPI003B92CDBC